MPYFKNVAGSKWGVVAFKSIQEGAQEISKSKKGTKA
jgi:hypothetical protein